MNKTVVAIVFVLCSCSNHMANLERREVGVTILSKNPIQTHCPRPHPFLLIAKDRQVVDTFQPWLEKQKLTFMEKAILWSLLQVNLRPDLVTPRSRLQVAIQYRRKTFYFDFTNLAAPNKHVANTFLSGLAHLARTFPGKNNLAGLAGLLDDWPVKLIPAGDQLTGFIADNKEKLKGKAAFGSFFKVGEPIRTGESIPKLPFAKLIRQYKIERFKITSHWPFTHSPLVSCSQDITRHHIAPAGQALGVPIGISDGKGNSFLALISLERDPTLAADRLFLVRGKNSRWPHTLCLFGNRLLGLAMDKRDSAQHLHHLSDELARASAPAGVAKALARARRLFLRRPPRIIFESTRDKSNQLRTLLAHKLPIYYSGSLGEIWTVGNFTDGTHWILDPRSEVSLPCL